MNVAPIRPREQVLFSFRGWSRFCWGFGEKLWGMFLGDVSKLYRPWGMFFGGMSNRKRPLCILEVDELVRRTDENIPQKVPKYESMSRKSYLWTRPKGASRGKIPKKRNHSFVPFLSYPGTHPHPEAVYRFFPIIPYPSTSPALLEQIFCAPWQLPSMADFMACGVGMTQPLARMPSAHHW